MTNDLLSATGPALEPEQSSVAGGAAVDVADRFGGYRIERVLGHSPLGIAALGRGTVSGRPVIVKILADDLAADPTTRRRFLRAAELACRLSHPNVVRVFHVDDNGRPFVVMEHTGGETLAQRTARDGHLSAAELLTLTTHLAAGLAHAHANGVVHGAVDPRTILLGDDGVARLCDFGLDRVLRPAGNAATAAVVHIGPYRGTPECAGRAMDPSGDVYALAKVLRQVGGDRLSPGLAVIVDAVLAPSPSLRPSAVDVLHQMHTIANPEVWLPPADASTWNTRPHAESAAHDEVAAVSGPPAKVEQGSMV